MTARPPTRDMEDFEPGSGDQFGSTSSRTEQQFKDMLFASRLSPSAQATIRSQGGPGAGMVLMLAPRAASRPFLRSCSVSLFCAVYVSLFT